MLSLHTARQRPRHASPEPARIGLAIAGGGPIGSMYELGALRALDEALEGLDLTSADGRAGIHTLLSEIERACPGVLLQQAARMELRAIGWPGRGGDR